MKKILAITLALMLALGVLSALADEETGAATATTDMSSITFPVTYTTTDSDAVQPEETFTFSDFECTAVENGGVVNGAVVTKDTAPVPATIASITLDSTTTSGTATINLPTYSAVGKYTYTFHQNHGSKAGVTYYESGTVQTMKLVVTVIEESGKKRVASVHVEGGDTAADKNKGIGNTYHAGKLTIGKQVTGTLGDHEKYFDVEVTFVPESGKTLASVIQYSGGKYSDKATVASNTATIQVKHNDTVTFENIPKGTTYTVTEADYTSDGYDAALYALNESASTTTAINSSIENNETDAAVITNNKHAEIDTGISLDTLPYVVLLAVAALGAALLFIRRRRREED